KLVPDRLAHRTLLSLLADPMPDCGPIASCLRSGGRSENLALPHRDDEGGGAGADLVGPAGRAARFEVEIDAVLAEMRHLGPAARVAHAVNEAQRRVAEMGDPAPDEIGLV